MLNAWRSVVALPVLVLASAVEAAIPVPQIKDIQIDGNGVDWKDQGTRVDLLTRIGKSSRTQFDAAFRIGWNERGLIVLATVHDPKATESDSESELWKADSLELFIADAVSGKDRVQFLIAPGRDASHTQLRHHAMDRRRDGLKSTPPDVETARTVTDQGYTVEVLLPWSNLGRDNPTAGDTLGFQFYANSQDEGQPRGRLVFHPKDNTHENSAAMHELTLSDSASTKLNFGIGQVDNVRSHSYRVNVRTTPELVGKRASIVMNSVDLDVEPMTAELEITADADGMGTGKVLMPIPDYYDAQLSMTMDEATSPAVRLPDPRLARAEAISSLELGFRPAVLTTSEFPAPEFANPERAEDLLGEFEITATYYDAQGQKVTEAKEPGRYAAVLEVKCEDGTVLRRFRTLYRATDKLDWWQQRPTVQATWPAELGLNAAVVQEQSEMAQDPIRAMVLDGGIRNGMGAELFAALHEIEPGAGPMNIMHDAESRDRAWWVKFKRKFYETDLRFTEPVDRPTVTDGPVSLSLRDGTDEEAGFAPGTRDQLDALMKEWAAASEEPFNVCVARNGVVILNAGYGTRDGQPVTADTPSIVYSISKAISGTAIMMAVDQGLMSLEDTVDKFLPALKNTAGRKPTIRQLFTHTAGMSGHWGDELNDFEEIVALQLPLLRIGEKHEYNGASLALGCKALEHISGESLVDYYQKHIFEPLGMNNTTSTSCSWRTYSTAGDLAKLGQMLLNQGSYGKLRFMRPDVYQLMLPHRLVSEIGPDTETEWGIGLSWMGDGKDFIGHGSASSSTFFVHPQKNIIITMARNTAGAKHGEFHKRFVELVLESAK